MKAIDVRIGGLHRITEDSAGGWPVYAGDTVRVVGQSNDLFLYLFVSGRGTPRAVRPKFEDFEYEYYCRASQLEPCGDPDEPPSSVDTFLLLGRTARGGF